MSQNIKNNLFRFVTLRSPQLIDEKENHPGFVYHPDETSVSEVNKNTFLKAIEGQPESEKQAKLKEERESFSQVAYKTIAEVKNAYSTLHKFSAWLMRNKNTLSYAEIKQNSEGVTLFADINAEIDVWENLIYQTISRESVYVREALIKLLVANQFLDAFNDLSENTIFTEEQKEEFTRRANASVVISKDVLLETYNDNIQKSSAKSVNTENQKRLSDLLTAKYDKVALKKLTDELKELQKAYEAQENTSYKTALDNHQKDVEAILDTGTIQLVDQWDIESQAYIKTEKLVHNPLPKFTYNKSLEIDAQELQTALSDLSYKYLTDNKLETLTSYEAILKSVKRLSKEKSNKAEQLLPKTSKSVVKGGVSMRLEDPFKATLTNFGDVDAYVAQMIEDDVSVDTIELTVASQIDSRQIDPSACYTVNLVVRTSALTSGGRDWNFLAGVSYNNEFSTVTTVDQSLSFTNDSSVINSTDFIIDYTLPNHSKVGLFENSGGISKPDTVGNPILSGIITLANGDTLEFSETIAMQPAGKVLAGSTLLSFNCKEESEETPSTFGKIYGVTNLGIADFRRVEQEVCCYVPGEVSHIENVMAREYKERTTRSLTSSEFTTEVTDERERENLTDTTSTERNEMQSEVSSVLNEDQSQSFGGNASFGGDIKGTKLHFNTGAYFDNSSSSSASNSNTQAQTYAQEVTERAMERIVQKTQTKRTSRILKEFEENSSHGFDNRKGTDHVTGVYRWVDKIYKNTLINYGKRLMYEFAIPEPSKFFQEAVWKDADEMGQTESGVVIPEAPVHPRDLGLTSSSALDNVEGDDKVDYQTIASKYNAEVSSKPETNIYVGKSFSSFTQASDSGEYRETMNGDEDLELPNGYKTLKAKALFKVPSEGNRKGCVVVGTNKFLYSVYANDSDVDYEDIDAYTEKIPVTFSSVGFHAGNINISIKCELTENGLQQWQNETYNAIMEAYNDRLQEYNDAIREKEAASGLIADEEKLTFNPLQNKSIMLRELKRVAIELLIDQNRISVNNFRDIDLDTGVFPVNKGEAFQTHASTVKFFEQAFDWDIMAYVFYPYFYADEADWKKLFQLQDAADPLFQAFLQSGMARTVVPVRSGFEDAVNWYMTTGEIWNGQGLVVDQEDDLYVSVADEMQTIEGVVEGTWETRLPTSLTVIQAGSIGLNVEGLPCNTDCDTFALFDTDGQPILNEDGTQQTENPIEQTDTLVGGLDGPEGVGSDAIITVQ